MREGYPHGTSADSAQLDGLVYWNPATEKVEFVAVAGRDDGQGRLFQGEYRRREDGTIVREYDVFYRTPGDTPAEALGGSRRRFLETISFATPDSIVTTLQWWQNGAWRPFGRFATGAQRRLPR